MTGDYRTDALKIAEARRPRSILAIGPKAGEVFNAFRQKNAS